MHPTNHASCTIMCPSVLLHLQSSARSHIPQAAGSQDLGSRIGRVRSVYLHGDLPAERNTLTIIRDNEIRIARPQAWSSHSCLSLSCLSTVCLQLASALPGYSSPSCVLSLAACSMPTGTTHIPRLCHAPWYAVERFQERSNS